MPTISIKKSDLARLVGRSIEDEELIKLLEGLKADVKELSDEEIIIEVTSDRPDMFSSEGVARSLKGLLEIEVGPPIYEVYDAKKGYDVFVDPSVNAVRPYIACAAVIGCELGDEGFRQIIQLQEVLHRTHGRGRRKFAIGLHNLDVVKPPITYIAKRFDDFSFKPLDSDREMSGREVLELHSKGVEYGWIIKDKGLAPLLIDSNENILSMPPIINSDLTKVTPETKNLLIDVTGIDLKAVEMALTILTTNLAERGGKIIKFVVHYGDKALVEPPLSYKSLTVNREELVKITGLNEPIDVIAKCLKKMRLGVTIKGDVLEVFVPPYRVDVISAVDVAEDYAMGYGYDKIEPIIPPITTQGAELKITAFTRLCRELMIGYGFHEVVSYMFSSDKKLDDAGIRDKRVKVLRPVSSDYTCLRTSLIPSLLSFLSENTHVEYPQKIFEVGDVILIDDKVDVKAISDRRLAALHADYKVGYEDIQAVLYSFMRLLNVRFEVEPHDMELMIKGRCGKVKVRNIDIGFLGEINPEVLLKFGLQVPVAAFEISISKIMQLME